MAIPGWNIEPLGVRSALSKTITAIQPMEGYARTCGEALYDAGYASGSDRVKAALAGFSDHHRNTIPLIFKRTSNCVRGAALATNAYLRADEEMAARAQRNAIAAPRVEDLRGGEK
ncbi:DUF6507 family protein [Actinomadura rupiterrae]|uniref:DUF6507 family protein n=1 Tax=Actinomadura rupiterrae TaxID=559627 RepID=UPI0020A49154|nr:DUF6507 family protein [Actinomadura rupiterrae]MCP2337578.1 hypothetical protein [Actinomadura rupiterrae]